MKKLLILSACLWALGSSPVLAQTAAPQLVVVRFYDGVAATKLVLVRADGSTQVLEVNGGVNAKSLTESGLTLQKVFAGLYQEGYTLKGTAGGGDGSRSTWVFVKER